MQGLEGRGGRRGWCSQGRTRIEKREWEGSGQWGEAEGRRKGAERGLDTHGPVPRPTGAPRARNRSPPKRSPQAKHVRGRQRPAPPDGSGPGRQGRRAKPEPAPKPSREAGVPRAPGESPPGGPSGPSQGPQTGPRPPTPKPPGTQPGGSPQEQQKGHGANKSKRGRRGGGAGTPPPEAAAPTRETKTFRGSEGRAPFFPQRSRSTRPGAAKPPPAGPATCPSPPCRTGPAEAKTPPQVRAPACGRHEGRQGTNPPRLPWAQSGQPSQ